MNVLLILYDPAYGSERSYNGLRLAAALARRADNEVRVFLIGDAVSCAVADRKAPEGWYRLDRMIETIARHGGEVGCCGTCLDARGGSDAMFTKCAARATLDWPQPGPSTLGGGGGPCARSRQKGARRCAGGWRSPALGRSWPTTAARKRC